MVEQPHHPAHPAGEPEHTPAASSGGEREHATPKHSANEDLKPLRFRVLDLIVLTTVLAFALAMIRVLGYFAAPLLFLVAVFVTAWPLPLWSPRSQASLASTFDITWGLLMPALCLALDPVFFKEDRAFWHGPGPDLFAIPPVIAFRIYWFTIPVYAAVGWQMVFLCIWLFAGRFGPQATAFWAGTLGAGFVIAGLTAVLLLIPSILGTLFIGLGLAGLSPWLTAWTFLRRTRQAAEIASRELPGGDIGTFEIAGFIGAFVIPAGIAACIMSLLDMSLP